MAATAHPFNARSFLRMGADLRNGRLRNFGGWQVCEQNFPLLVNAFCDLATFFANKMENMDPTNFENFLKTRYNLVDQSEMLVSHHSNIVNFITRDEKQDQLTDPRAQPGSGYRPFLSTFDNRSVDILCLSFIMESYSKRGGIPSKSHFEQIHGVDIPSQLWKNARKHRSGPFSNRPHLYKVNGKPQIIDDDDILQAAIDSEVIHEIPQLFNRLGEQMYSLAPGRYVSDEIKPVTSFLKKKYPHIKDKINESLVERYWPRDQVKIFKDVVHKCKHCNTRKGIIHELFHHFGIECDPCARSHARVWSLKKLHTHLLKLGPGIYRRLNLQQKKE